MTPNVSSRRNELQKVLDSSIAVIDKTNIVAVCMQYGMRYGMDSLREVLSSVSAVLDAESASIKKTE